MAAPTPNTAPIATFFIGGAADKTRFWGLVPVTNLIASELITRYLGEIGRTGNGGAEVNPTLAQAYFGYDETEKIFERIKALHQQQPGVRVRLIGHSLGGWRAAKLSAQLAEVGIKPALLVTIDPVGVFYFPRYEMFDIALPRPAAQVWINILANPIGKNGIDDHIAELGSKWQPAHDSGLRNKPTFDYSTPLHHAQVWKMMTFPGAGGRSAWDFLKDR
jgi:pimeloyl-ACP methyl ester carboxylesterase